MDILKVKLLFFAKSRELVGQSVTFIELPSSVTGQLLLHLILDQYPSLKILSESLLLSHNEEYIDVVDNITTLTLKSGDEIAVIPPISGG